MGQFVVAFSFVIVVLQATTLLLERPASTWSFWLVDASPNNVMAPAAVIINGSSVKGWQGLSFTFGTNYSFNRDTLSIWWSNQTKPSDQQIACILSTPASANNNELPTHCLLRTHATQTIKTVLKEWNPHAILLTLCCIQLILCISKTQHAREIKQKLGTITNNRDLHIPLAYGLALLSLLILIVLILTGIKDPHLVQYPTIIAIAALLGMTGWFVWQFSKGHADDAAWNLAFHMQLVSVPLAVLSITTMGARLWTDVIIHSVLLNAAVNCLWLQDNLGHPWAQQICRGITILLPTLCLSLAHIQWGYADSWKYAIALMGCAGLLPLYVFTILLPLHDNDGAHNGRVRLRMSHLCAGGALLSLTVNTALFFADV